MKWSDVVVAEVDDTENLVTNYYKESIGTKSRCYRCTQ
jgi:hypothetical protein